MGGPITGEHGEETVGSVLAVESWDISSETAPMVGVVREVGQEEEAMVGEGGKFGTEHPENLLKTKSTIVPSIKVPRTDIARRGRVLLSSILTQPRGLGS